MVARVGNVDVEHGYTPPPNRHNRLIEDTYSLDFGST